jgi:hypothetical protein
MTWPTTARGESWAWCVTDAATAGQAQRLQESGDEGTEADHAASGDLDVGGTSGRGRASTRASGGAGNGARVRATGGRGGVAGVRARARDRGRAGGNTAEDDGGAVVGADGEGQGAVASGVGDGNGLDASADSGDGDGGANVGLNSRLGGGGRVGGGLSGNGSISGGLAGHDTERVGGSEERRLGEGIDRGGDGSGSRGDGLGRHVSCVSWGGQAVAALTYRVLGGGGGGKGRDGEEGGGTHCGLWVVGCGGCCLEIKRSECMV